MSAVDFWRMQPATSQPKRIAQYEVVETLGLVGKLRLYRALDREAQRNVILKTVTKDMRDPEIAELVTRFQSEAQISSQLRHPGIIEVYEYGEDSEVAFVASEVVEGCALKSRLRVPISDAGSLMVQLLKAL